MRFVGERLGYVRVEATITNPERVRSAQFIFSVDSGSWYTAVPPFLAEKIGLRPAMKTVLTLADGRSVEVDLSPAYVKVMDREVATLIAVINVPEPILGIEALEALGLELDPITGKLEVARPYTTLLV